MKNDTSAAGLRLTERTLEMFEDAPLALISPEEMNMYHKTLIRAYHAQIIDNVEGIPTVNELSLEDKSNVYRMMYGLFFRTHLPDGRMRPGMFVDWAETVRQAKAYDPELKLYAFDIELSGYTPLARLAKLKQVRNITDRLLYRSFVNYMKRHGRTQMILSDDEPSYTWCFYSIIHDKSLKKTTLRYYVMDRAQTEVIREYDHRNHIVPLSVYGMHLQLYRWILAGDLDETAKTKSHRMKYPKQMSFAEFGYKSFEPKNFRMVDDPMEVKLGFFREYYYDYLRGRHHQVFEIQKNVPELERGYWPSCPLTRTCHPAREYRVIDTYQ